MESGYLYGAIAGATRRSFLVGQAGELHFALSLMEKR